MFGQLQDKFKKIFKTVRGHGKISEHNIDEAIREIRIALLESDVNFKVVSSFISRVKEKSLGSKVFDSVTPGQQFVKLVLDELIDFLDSKDSDINLSNKSLSVVVLSGLQGSGKTTTAAKLAGFLKREFNKQAMLIGLDLQRPAATEQLKILAENNSLPYYIESDSKDVLDVLNNGLKFAKKEKVDTVILDTAGRLHIDDNLISELKKIIDISKPSEVLYIADGMSGQDAVNSSKIFSESCDVTGCIITKLDGDSGAGASLSIKEVTGVPIKFITFGEKYLEIDIFDSNRIARRILGLDDIVGIVEKASKSISLDKISDIKSKIKNDTFDLNDFRTQLDQMNNMGSLSSLVKLLPNMKKISNLNVNEKNVISTKAMLDSMTNYERENPDIINGSRRKRIALGSGTSMQKVNQLLKQFKQMKTLMKKMKNNKFGKLPF